jgi:hypothetical protein
MAVCWPCFNGSCCDRPSGERPWKSQTELSSWPAAAVVQP